MARNYDTTGTPINQSLISRESDLDFDISDNLSSSGPGGVIVPAISIPALANSVPSPKGTPQPSKPVVYRVWHPDNLFKNVEDKDLQSITSFKSCLIKDTTIATEIRDFVAGKLLIEDKNHFRIYAIRDQSKTPVKDNELVMPLINDISLKLAFLVDSEENQLKTIVGASLFDVASDCECREGALVMHRRLLASERLKEFANVIFKFKSADKIIRIYSFRAILALRSPELLEFEAVIKKKKEKKTSFGPILTVEVKDDCFLTSQILVSLLDYVYSDNLDFPKFTISELLHTLLAAKFIGSLSRLVWLCERFLYGNLGFHNVYEMLKVSHELQLTSVKNFCVAFAHSKWAEFSSNRGGLEILGLDLFQDLTVMLHAQKKQADTSYLDQAAPASTYVEDLKLLYEKMEFTDATAEFADGVVIKFHRALFATHEPKFLELFMERKDSHKPFKFPISAESFTFMQQFIYYGSCSISVSCACEVIEEMVEKFSLEKFRDRCEHEIATDINTNIVLRSLRLTYLPLNQPRVRLVTTVRENCLNFVADNFTLVDVPSIRQITPCGSSIAFDLLELLHIQKRNAKRRRPTASKKRKTIHFA